MTFEDGSVGWYECGWGPMMSETAFFGTSSHASSHIILPRGALSSQPYLVGTIKIDRI